MKRSDCNQMLLVEGNDDLHVVSALCEHFKVRESFKIKDCNGIENILMGLPVWLKGAGETKAIGVIADADASMGSRWQAVREILIISGRYADIPVSCPSDGLIINPQIADDMTFGLWIMPDNGTDGMLENFVSCLVPENDCLLPVADKVLSEIEIKRLNKYPAGHHEKARIHTWLAWQEDPGTPTGLAVTKKYLTTDSHVCHDFIDWLNRLFN